MQRLSRFGALAFSLLSFIGCTSGEILPPDAQQESNLRRGPKWRLRDLSTPSDLAQWRDLAQAPSDLASAPDLSLAPAPGSTDMAVSGLTASSVDPVKGPPASFVTVSGAGFQSGDSVQLSSAAIGTLTLGTLSLTTSAIVAALPSSLPTGAAKLRVARGGAAVPSAGLDFTVSSGRVFYAAPNGSDSGSGSASAPWQRLDTAASKMSPGDVLYLRGGTYSTAYRVTTSGTATAPLSFIGYPGETATLSAPSTSAQYTTLSVQASYLIFKNLHITDAHVPGNAVEIVYAAHDVTFADCEIYGAKGQGAIVVGSRNTFLRNRIHDNGYNGKFDHGIYVQGAYNTLRGNHIYNNMNYGIHLYNGSPNPGGYNLAEENYVYHNGYGAKAAVPGYTDTAGVIMADVHPGNVVRNNILCDNADYGLLMVASQPSQQVTGNVSCYNHTGGFYLYQPGSGSIFKGNVSFNDAQPTLKAYSGISSDNNVYWLTGGTPKLQWQGTTYTTLPAFQSASGQDKSSRIADPQFTNVPTSGFSSAKIGTYDFCTPVIPALCDLPMIAN